MSLELVLSRLKGVRRSGTGYVAKCPAHEDRSPSLAVKDAGNGRILIHCFGGCETWDVLLSMGLRFSDVMPERLTDWRGEADGSWKRGKRGFSPADVIACLASEAAVIALIAVETGEGRTVDADTAARACMAAGRLAEAMEVCRA